VIAARTDEIGLPAIEPGDLVVMIGVAL